MRSDRIQNGCGKIGRGRFEARLQLLDPSKVGPSGPAPHVSSMIPTMAQPDRGRLKRGISAIYHEPALWITGAPWQSLAQATHADLTRMREIVVK